MLLSLNKKSSFHPSIDALRVLFTVTSNVTSLQYSWIFMQALFSPSSTIYLTESPFTHSRSFHLQGDRGQSVKVKPSDILAKRSPPRERRERSHFYISSSRSRFYTTVTSLPIWSFLPPPEYAKHCSPLDDVIEQLANEEWACVLPVELNSAIGDGITSLAIFWLYLKRAIFNTVHIYIQ